MRDLAIGDPGEIPFEPDLRAGCDELGFLIKVNAIVIVLSLASEPANIHFILPKATGLTVRSVVLMSSFNWSSVRCARAFGIRPTG